MDKSKGKTNITKKIPKVTSLKKKSKAPAKTEWHIGFLITLNTNYAPKSDAEAAIIGNDMQKVADELFTNEGNLNDFITYRNAAFNGRSDLITSVDVEADAEVGPKIGRVHQHVKILITHKIPPKGIWMNRQGILDFYHTHATTVPVQLLPYINIKVFFNPATLTDYLNKAKAKE